MIVFLSMYASYYDFILYRHVNIYIKNKVLFFFITWSFPILTCFVVATSVHDNIS